jgi:hypothetical protein
MKRIKFFILVALVSLVAPQSQAQSPTRRPWALKVDLAGYASQTLAVEGEFMLTLRLSVLGQAGHVSGEYFYGFLDSYGFQARIGAKCYLGLAQAEKMGGFAIRCELAGRYWHSREYHANFDQLQAVGIAAMSYAWHPFDRILVEPYVGLGRSRARMDFRDHDSRFSGNLAPNSPWVTIHSGDFEYDHDMLGYNWSAWQCAFGLLLGFRI